MLKDATEDLEQQTKAVQRMIDGHDRVVIGAGPPERAIDCSKFQQGIQERASYKAGYVVALAKSKMLDGFGQDEAADVLIRPNILNGE